MYIYLTTGLKAVWYPPKLKVEKTSAATLPLKPVVEYMLADVHSFYLGLFVISKNISGFSKLLKPNF